MEYKELNKQFWGLHLWAREYFVASSRNVYSRADKLYHIIQDYYARESALLVNFGVRQYNR